MKLTGSITEIEERVAKRKPDGSIEIKRGYNVSFRPATGHQYGDYGYGSMKFIIHGAELKNLDVGLGDKVDILVVKEGADYDGKALEDARYQVAELTAEVEKLRAANEAQAGYLSNANNLAASLKTNNDALRAENVRQLTELLTLKTLMGKGTPTDLIEG